MKRMPKCLIRVSQTPRNFVQHLLFRQVRAALKVLQFYFGHIAVKAALQISVQFGKRLVVLVPLSHLFKPMFVDIPASGGWYIDGGLLHNNPSQIALEEAHRIWPIVMRFCIVSIGAGLQKNVEFIDIKDSDAPKGKAQSTLYAMFPPILRNKIVQMVKNTPTGVIALKKIGQAYVDMSTSSEPIHESVFKLANSAEFDLRFPYHRFNVERGIDSIGLEEWNAMRIAELTGQYMRESEVEMKRNRCVQDLWEPVQVEC